MSLIFNQKITLDLTVSRVQNIHCSQDDDNSRNILITLSDKGKPYILTDNEKIFLKISKPDNTFIYIDVKMELFLLFYQSKLLVFLVFVKLSYK